MNVNMNVVSYHKHGASMASRHGYDHIDDTTSRRGYDHIDDTTYDSKVLDLGVLP